MRLFKKLHNEEEEQKILEQVIVEPPVEDNSAAIAQADAAKKILRDAAAEKKVLSHAQLHLICASYNLVMRHYSDFAAPMPASKIFSMPKCENKYKMYTCANYSVGNWTSGGKPVRADSAKHGIYYSEQEVKNYRDHWSKLDAAKGVVNFNFREVPAIFIIAPEDMFNARKAAKMTEQDPIIVERIGEDEYTVASFWNVPEQVAVHISNPNNN